MAFSDSNKRGHIGLEKTSFGDFVSSRNKYQHIGSNQDRIKNKEMDTDARLPKRAQYLSWTKRTQLSTASKLHDYLQVENNLVKWPSGNMRSVISMYAKKHEKRKRIPY
ncbi:hypothetical protein M408DRAFT_11524 [Serendipita vermifera MAFF 305830]|uniref:Uncharacterized protein n=1 Tax=Serendipita vermifera MAFF 305830 TaxID=933852 RepID=A0A0C3AVV6_SERVB|nr:hypothetical protein M408DRAFT_11524 [Serendipita vermifera MAFF 305830]